LAVRAAAWAALVPLVVLMTTTRPATWAERASRGLLPRSNRGGFSPPVSPARTTSSSLKARALSRLGVQYRASAPASRKAAAVVVARITSTTSTTSG